MGKRSEYMREYQKKNRQHLTEYMRKWRKENPEKQRAITERYWRKKLGLDADPGEAGAVQA